MLISRMKFFNYSGLFHCLPPANKESLSDSTRVSVTRAREAARLPDLSELRDHCSNVSNCVIGEREMEIVSKSYYRGGRNPLGFEDAE